MSKEIEWLLKEKYRGDATGAKSEAFRADCKRLENGEPLAYVIGHIPFLDTTIYLDSKPLIPRPETEFWVEKAISAIKTHTNADFRGQNLKVRCLTPYFPRILDLCAGSGAIGVAVAKAIPEAIVTFVEIDPAHLPTIEKNLRSNHIINDMMQNRCHIIQSNLFENITETSRFDFILSNPPYIEANANTIEKGVVDFEPSLALFGGKGGFEIIERIITGAKAVLTPKGELWIEHEPFQAKQIETVATQTGYICTCSPDQYDTIRYSRLVLQ